jgi:hypothetical protein
MTVAAMSDAQQCAEGEVWEAPACYITDAPSDTVMAVVGGEEIRLADVDLEVMSRKFYAPMVQEYMNSGELRNALRPKALASMITVKLLANEARRRELVSDQFLSEAFAGLVASIENDPTLLEEIRIIGDPNSLDYQRRMKEDLAAKVMIDNVNPVTVNDDEIRKFYEGWKKWARERTLIRASNILIRIPKNATRDVEAVFLGKAYKIYGLAKEPGQSFSELAYKFSEALNSTVAGYMGKIAPNQHGEELELAIDGMDVGEITLPFRSPLGWSIVKLPEKSGPKLPS